MRSSLSTHLEPLAGIVAVLALALFMAVEAQAQVTVMTPLPAPPPLKLVPREDRAQLESARDAKARARLSVELAELRLQRAESLTRSQQYESAARELGIYQGILDNTLRYLKDQKEQKKLRDVYRRFEISLRAHGSRLETIRRSTPSEYAFNVKTITDYTKSLRGEALNGFYGDTVIRDDYPEEEEKPREEKETAGSSQTTTKEQP